MAQFAWGLPATFLGDTYCSGKIPNNLFRASVSLFGPCSPYSREASYFEGRGLKPDWSEHQCPWLSSLSETSSTQARKLTPASHKHRSRGSDLPSLRKAMAGGSPLEHRLIIWAHKGPQCFTSNPPLKQIQERALSEPLQIKLHTGGRKQSWHGWHHLTHLPRGLTPENQESANSLWNQVGWRLNKGLYLIPQRTPLPASLPLQVKVRSFFKILIVVKYT